MRTMSPVTSIIVCAHNRVHDLTIPCVESIKKNTPRPYELILVDDASSDGTIDYFRSQSRKAYRLEGGAHGPGMPRNVGLMAVGGEGIVFVDNDALMPPRWLDTLITGQRTGGAGIVAGVPSDKRHETYALSANYLVDVDEVGFGCALLTIPVYRAVGFFDPALTWGGQDTDYCFRAKARGFRVQLMPQFVYEHRGHGTTTPANPKRQESVRRLYQKWPHERSIQRWPHARSMMRPR